MGDLDAAVEELEPELIECARELVRIRSYSGREEAAIRYVEARMRRLGYDDVRVDAMGNVLGRIGRGGRAVLFDSHLDTVEVPDESEWAAPPFEGRIVDGRLHGRGSVDMKSAVAASIYGAVIARRLGWAEGRTVYVAGSVMEEDCDGENLRHLFGETGVRPHSVVICEPSGNRVMRGHKGKAQLVVRTLGVSAHGAAPRQGRNAVYEMAEIVKRVEALNDRLGATGGGGGTVIVAGISSRSASLNAVPSECRIQIDRRLGAGEDEEVVNREMAELTGGGSAEWEVDVIRRESWTGMPVEYRPFHPPWELAEDHPLAQACDRAYESVFGRPAPPHGFWDFSTNAVTPVAMGIPTIGFGPGDPRQAHMRDESCPLDQITDAARFYAALIREAG